jgi:hypothetical protein
VLAAANRDECHFPDNELVVGKVTRCAMRGEATIMNIEKILVPIDYSMRFPLTDA